MCFTTNNNVLLNKHRLLPAIFCIQRKGEKKIVTEEDIIESNKISFGDAIGATTNVITSQVCALAKFEPGSREHDILSYRVLCGQHFQQVQIDKAKGIIAKPMPKYWHDLKSRKSQQLLNQMDEYTRFLNERIVVDRKPYFFIYNYDHLYSRYKKYIKKADTSSQREFGISVSDLLKKENKTEAETKFIEYYKKYLPVDEAPCAVNRMCWYIEKNLIPPTLKRPEKEFDYRLLKSPANSYTEKQYRDIKPLLEKEYKAYRQGIKELAKQLQENAVHGTERAHIIEEYGRAFLMKINIICPDDALKCDVLLDIAYKSNVSKRFIWIICGPQIIRNLLQRHGNEALVPEKSITGNPEFYFKGEGYSMSRYYVEPEGLNETIQENSVYPSSDVGGADSDI